MLHSILFLAAGVVVLVFGADLMVRGASALALRLGLSPLFVGLTVVAFATSAPELVVSIRSSLAGYPDLAIGNVVGSNICNICVILGITAVVIPIPCSRMVILRDAPLVVLVTGLFWVLCRGDVSRLESAVLCAVLVTYIGLTYLANRKASAALVLDIVDEEIVRESAAPSSVLRHLLFVGAGLGGLLLGADLLVRGAVAIAERLGMSEAVIGLTVVAIGTSLPEVATSFVAALKKQPDLAIGNVLGSNLWNLLGVAGMTGMIQGLPVADRFLTFDLPVCIGVSVVCAVFMATGRRVGRLEGVTLLGLYGGYVFYCLKRIA